MWSKFPITSSGHKKILESHLLSDSLRLPISSTGVHSFYVPPVPFVFRVTIPTSVHVRLIEYHEHFYLSVLASTFSFQFPRRLGLTTQFSFGLSPLIGHPTDSGSGSLVWFPLSTEYSVLV